VPAHVRGLVVCDGCGKTATVTASVSTRPDFELWWDLPVGWRLYGRGRGSVAVYCQSSCVKNSAVMGHPDQQGRRTSESSAYDARTLDKLYELIECAAGDISADNVLAAIEAVLFAWRQKAAIP